MKYCLLIIVFFVFSSSSSELTTYERYQIEKVEVNDVVKLNLVWSGLGSYYATGKFAKTIIFPLLTIASVTTGILVLNAPHGGSTHQAWGIILTSGMPTIIKSISIFDAVKCTKRHNRDLKKRLHIHTSFTPMKLDFTLSRK